MAKKGTVVCFPALLAVAHIWPDLRPAQGLAPRLVGEVASSVPGHWPGGSVGGDELHQVNDTWAVIG